jgi:mannosyltransferase OCH1-like enzyme
MVQRRDGATLASTAWSSPIPKRIVQFWSDLQRLPEGVKACMDSWKQLEQTGFELEVFDESSARTFIRDRFSDQSRTAIEVVRTVLQR